MVSDPIRTDFGYHLIKVEEIQEAGYEPVEAVRTELRTRLVREEAQRLAESKAQAAYNAMVAAGSEWKTAVQTLRLVPRETPFVAQGEVVEELTIPLPSCGLLLRYKTGR